ncbi:dienelactone hydrolase family protein [Paracoccus panacisoli]|uniref:Dienelactone hydrolase family protein n=1 Tax=Paracoccus panacisoli TaxID=1510163 RepID=A0ABV6T760_9RHOB
MKEPTQDRRRPGRARRLVALLGAALVLLVVLAGTNTLRNKAGIAITDDTPAERRALLEPFWRMVGTDAAPSPPVEGAAALLMSGCDGPHDNMDYWGAVLAGAGRPALVVDSHGPRGLDEFDLWRLVCAGQVLPGAERAGDVAVALAATRASQVTLLGASHGGWTVMELMAQLATGDAPHGLTAWPAPPADLARRIDRVVLLYPYCGALNGAEAGDWSAAPPILMVLGSEDRVISTPDCTAMAEALRRRGADIRVIELPGIDHGFDQAERSALSPLKLVPEAREATRRAVLGFLDAGNPR